MLQRIAMAALAGENGVSAKWNGFSRRARGLDAHLRKVSSAQYCCAHPELISSAIRSSMGDRAHILTWLLRAFSQNRNLQLFREGVMPMDRDG